MFVEEVHSSIGTHYEARKVDGKEEAISIVRNLLDDPPPYLTQLVIHLTDEEGWNE